MRCNVFALIQIAYALFWTPGNAWADPIHTLAIPPEELQTGGSAIFDGLESVADQFPGVQELSDSSFERIFVNQPLNLELLGPGTNVVFVSDEAGNFGWAISNGRFEAGETNGRLSDGTFPIDYERSGSGVPNMDGKYPWPIDADGKFIRGDRLVASNGPHDDIVRALKQLPGHRGKTFGGHVAVGKSGKAVIGYVSGSANKSEVFSDKRILDPKHRDDLHESMKKAFRGRDLAARIADAPLTREAIDARGASAKFPMEDLVSVYRSGNPSMRFLPESIRDVFEQQVILGKPGPVDSLYQVLDEYPNIHVVKRLVETSKSWRPSLWKAAENVLLISSTEHHTVQTSELITKAIESRNPWPPHFIENVPNFLRNFSNQKREAQRALLRGIAQQQSIPRDAFNGLARIIRGRANFSAEAIEILKKHPRWTKDVWKAVRTKLREQKTAYWSALQFQERWPKSIVSIAEAELRTGKPSIELLRSLINLDKWTDEMWDLIPVLMKRDRKVAKIMASALVKKKNWPPSVWQHIPDAFSGAPENQMIRALLNQKSWPMEFVEGNAEFLRQLELGMSGRQWDYERNKLKTLKESAVSWDDFAACMAARLPAR